MFLANAHKNAQGYCQLNKDSICYNLPLHTHDEDHFHFHHPQILNLASGTDTEWIFNRDKNIMKYTKKKQRNCYKGKTLTTKSIHVLRQQQI